MRTVAGLTLVGVLVGAALTGYGGRVTVAGPPDAGRGAGEMLALAPMLPGAQRTSALPGKAFQAPAQHPACEPLTVRTAFWSSTISGPTASPYLQTHTGPDFDLESSGSGSDAGRVTSWTVVLEPHQNSVRLPSEHRPDDVVGYVIARRGSGIGVRVDAVVVPDHAGCTSS